MLNLLFSQKNLDYKCLTRSQMCKRIHFDDNQLGLFDFYFSGEYSSQEHANQYTVFKRNFHPQLFKTFFYSDNLMKLLHEFLYHILYV